MTTRAQSPDRRPVLLERDLRGAVVLVTGGGRGLGRVMAMALSAAGASVGLIARSRDQLDETVRLVAETGGTAAAAAADVSDERSAAEAIGSLRNCLGPVDVLVNNAGVAGPIGRVWEVDPDQWWRTVEINLKGVLVCTRLVLSDMIGRGGGRIINVTSEAGVYRWPNVSAYAVSKSAVVKFTENLAAETKREGVVVLSVHPGLHAVGLTETVLAHDALPGSAQAEVADWLRKELTGQRAACPERAAELIVRLAAGGGDALSGRHLSVHDDLDRLIERVADIRRDDLCTLRLRPGGSARCAY
ncbi:MAG: SDR family oxidoreductase [Actinomycetota bacterium]|nr:SDR family oxidoreductase [Actinomycetota bacterium]